MAICLGRRRPTDVREVLDRLKRDVVDVAAAAAASRMPVTQMGHRGTGTAEASEPPH